MTDKATQLSAEKTSKRILTEVISKHCRCCDFPKHFYDDDITKIINEELSEVIKNERKRIMGAFMIAGSALTMFQNNESIFWAMDEIRKSMLEITKTDTGK